MSCEFDYEYKEKKGSNPEKISFSEGGFEATRVWEGPYNDRFNFIYNYLVTYSSSSGRYLPQRYPVNIPAYLDEVTIQGVGAIRHNSTTGMIEYDRAIITAKYKTKPYNQNDEEDQPDNERWVNKIFIEEEIDSNITIAQANKEEFKDHGVIIEAGGPLNIPIITATIIITETFVMRPWWFEIGVMCGVVNSLAFITPSGFVCPKETLRYDGPFGVTKVNPITGGGVNDQEEYPLPIWRLSHRFSFDRNGHNSVMKPDGTFRRVENADGFAPLKSDDLYMIFFGITGSLNLWGATGFNRSLIDASWAAIQNHINADPTNSYLDAEVLFEIENIKNYVRAMGFNG